MDSSRNAILVTESIESNVSTMVDFSLENDEASLLILAINESKLSDWSSGSNCAVNRNGVWTLTTVHAMLDFSPFRY